MEHDLKAKAHSLHANGWLEIGKLPEWSVFDMIEEYYAKYHDRILKLLERERSRWFEDVEECDIRPGVVVARELSRRFESKGIYISAVHPSVSDDKSLNYPVTGPRFYVSVMQAAMRRGPAPPPPEDIVSLLWPNEEDRRKPWVTEVGWVMTPPNSDAQAMHADIMSYSKNVTDPREALLGRFHHVIWKPDRTSNCTTGVVSSAFTNGKLQDWMYSSLQRVASPTVLLDSEMCHCGTPSPDRWTASCTVQVCSSTGWKPLQNRAPKALLEYTCPIDFKVSCPWVELPLDRQLIPALSEQERAKKLLKAGVKLSWAVGSLVEAEFEHTWFPAVIAEGSSDKTSYLVRWDGEGDVAEAVHISNIRPRRWGLASQVEAKWFGAWYPAKVMKVRSDWSYRVDWDSDGTCSHVVDHCDIRPRSSEIQEHPEPCKAGKKRSRSEASTDASSNSLPSGKRHR